MDPSTPSSLTFLLQTQSYNNQYILPLSLFLNTWLRGEGLGRTEGTLLRSWEQQSPEERLSRRFSDFNMSPWFSLTMGSHVLYNPLWSQWGENIIFHTEFRCPDPHVHNTIKNHTHTLTQRTKTNHSKICSNQRKISVKEGSDLTLGSTIWITFLMNATENVSQDTIPWSISSTKAVRVKDSMSPKLENTRSYKGDRPKS